MFKKLIRGIFSSIALLALAGQALALPTESDNYAIVRFQWQSAPVLESSASNAMRFITRETVARGESVSLLSTFDLPGVIDASASGVLDQPIGCITAAAMEGSWLDTALMRLVSPMDLARHYDPKKRARRR